jgi:sterol-4alpha-carboxylate 3-dehydrogenase (decarboxylating)
MKNGEHRRCLVTGAGGFLGRALAQALRARGDTVVSFDLPGVHVEGESVGGDIRDAEALTRAARGCDVVFHLASVVDVRRSARRALHAINVGGTERVIEACRASGVPKLVYCSSASVVYEGHDIENGDEALPYGRGAIPPYAESKRIAEERVLAADSRELSTVSLRPHLVFGPGDTRMMPQMLAHAAGRVPLIIGDPDKLSDFTYVDNAAEAHLLAADRLAPGSALSGRAYFISNGEPRSYWAFINQVLEGLGRKPLKRRVPRPIAWAAAWLNEQTVARVRGGHFTTFTVNYLSTHHYFSHARATTDFGYRPCVSLDEGIARTVRALAATSARPPR